MLARNNDIDTNHSCLQGYVYTRYSKLVKLFGVPTFGPDDFDDDKVTCEWILKDDETGTLVKIYDYKMGRTPREPYRWHVGGFDGRALDLAERAGDGE